MEEATYRGTVYPWQCDHVGHMNIMWYVGKFDEANWNLFARIGLTPSYLRESGRGMAAVQQNIAYKRELLAGDIVEIRSRLLEIREKSIRFLHEMRNAETGEIAATCEITGVHMDRRLRKSDSLRGSHPHHRDEARSRSPSRRRPDSHGALRAEKSGFSQRGGRQLSAGSRRCARSAFRSRGSSRARSISRWPIRRDFTQQNGFVHAGDHHRGPRHRLRHRRLHADAGGFRHSNRGIQDQPAGAREWRRGSSFRAVVIKPGRTLTICDARAYAERDGAEHLVATMTGTLMALARREPANSQGRVLATAELTPGD